MGQFLESVVDNSTEAEGVQERLCTLCYLSCGLSRWQAVYSSTADGKFKYFKDGVDVKDIQPEVLCYPVGISL